MVSKIRDKIISTSAVTRIPIVLVGNKIDRNDERVVSTEEGQLLANQWKVQFVEASAMNFKDCEEIFEKSIKAMDNVDTNENGTNDNSINLNLNQTNTSASRSSVPSLNKNSNTKLHRYISNKQQSTNKAC